MGGGQRHSYRRQAGHWTVAGSSQLIRKHRDRLTGMAWAFDSPPPGSQPFQQAKPHNPPLTGPPTGSQAFKSMSLYRLFPFEPPQRPLIYNGVLRQVTENKVITTETQARGAHVTGEYFQDIWEIL